jgi:hypothetical protein
MKFVPIQGKMDFSCFFNLKHSLIGSFFTFFRQQQISDGTLKKTIVSTNKMTPPTRSSLAHSNGNKFESQLDPNEDLDDCDEDDEGGFDPWANVPPVR